jgi:hypothetical protein
MQTVGLQANLIHDPQEIRQLTAFFAWASVADRPGQDYSYTSNFPFCPLVGNKASTDCPGYLTHPPDNLGFERHISSEVGPVDRQNRL